MRWKRNKWDAVRVLAAIHLVILVGVIAVLVIRKGEPASARERIAVIPIEGVISLDEALGRGPSVDGIVRTIHALAEDDAVKALVLRINSPGGSVAAVQEIHRALLAFRAEGKTIVSSFGDVAASGGYYLACAGEHIVANPGTLTGSIGVVMQLPNVEGLLEKVGVAMEVVKAGEMKDAGSPFRAMTEVERRHFGEVIADAYDQFITAVSEGRSFEPAALTRIADGRIFSGRMALQNGMVDEMGGLKEAIEAAKRLTGLEEKRPRIVTHKERPSLTRFLRQLGGPGARALERWPTSGVQIQYILP